MADQSNVITLHKDFQEQIPWDNLDEIVVMGIRKDSDNGVSMYSHNMPMSQLVWIHKNLGLYIDSLLRGEISLEIPE